MLLTILFCSLGLAALVAGICTFVRQYTLKKRCTTQVRGTLRFIPFEDHSETGSRLRAFVLEASRKIMREEHGPATCEAYSEILTYSLDGTEYAMPIGHVTSDTRMHSLGQNVVTVACDPSDPTCYYVLENRNTLYFFISTLILGPIFMVVPLLAFWQRAKGSGLDGPASVMVPFVLGVLFAGVGVFLWWRDKKLRQECIGQTPGVVCNVGRTTSYKKGRRKDSYRITYAYSVEGIEYTRQSNTTTSIPAFSKEQKVSVFYDPSRPQRSYVLEEGRTIAAMLVPFILGVLLMTVGLAVPYM